MLTALDVPLDQFYMCMDHKNEDTVNTKSTLYNLETNHK